MRRLLLAVVLSLLAGGLAHAEAPLRCRAADPTAAVLRLSALFRVDPIPEVLPEMGACLARIGQREGAIAVLESYLGLEPEGPLAARVRASVEALRRSRVALRDLLDPFAGEASRTTLRDLRDPFGAPAPTLDDLKTPF